MVHTFNPPSHTLLKMDAKLTALASGLNVPATFVQWLQTNGIMDCDSMALLAPNEEKVETKIIETAAAAIAIDKTKLRDVIAVTKLWSACRKAYDAPDKAVSIGSASAPEEVMPKEAAEDMASHWASTHKMTLPDAWLLTATLQGKLWRAVSAPTPKMEMIFMEQMRLLSSLSRTEGTQINILGRSVEATTQVADVVTCRMEFCLRARAWFATMAYVSIRKTDWFDFQAAVFGSDKLMEIAFRTVRGEHAPVAHLCACWAASMQYWAEATRISKQKLKDVIMNTGAWEHKWAWGGNVSSGSNNNNIGGGNRQPAQVDLPNDVQRELEKFREAARVN